MQNVVDIDSDIIHYAALGTETLEAIGLRYGLTAAQVEALRADPVFKRAVLVKKAELEASGDVFRFRSAMTANKFLTAIHNRLSNVDDIPLSGLLDGYKTTAKMADLEPKQALQVGNGTGFTVNIILGGAKSPDNRPPIEAEVVVDKTASDATMTFLEAPAGISVPSINLNSDLDYDE